MAIYRAHIYELCEKRGYLDLEANSEEEAQELLDGADWRTGTWEPDNVVDTGVNHITLID